MSAFANLYSGTTSYGELTKARTKLYVDLQAKVDSVIKELTAKRDEEQRRQQEIAARQLEQQQRAQELREAEERQQRFAQQQQEQLQAQRNEEAKRQAIINMMIGRQNAPVYVPPVTYTPMQIPKTTTNICSAYGNQVNCTTR